MKIIDFLSLAKFSSEKMQQKEIFRSQHLSTEILCLDSGQTLKSQEIAGSDRVFFVIEGTGRFHVGRTTREVESGNAVMVNAGDPHGIVNMTDKKLLVLSVTAPISSSS